MKAGRKALVLLAVLLLAGCHRDPKAIRDRYLDSGKRYLTAKRYDEAIIQFRNALKVDAGYAPTYLDLAKAFQESGDHQRALGAYQQVLKIDSKNTEAKTEICRYYIAAGWQERSAGYFRRAEEMANEILEAEPSNVQARILLGNAYAALNATYQAIDAIEKALALDPGNLTASLSLGAVQFQKQDLEAAEKTFREIIQKHPESPRAYAALGTFLMRTLRQQEAEANFRKAFDLEPTNPLYLTALAQYYTYLKRNTDAENVFKEAIKRKPDFQEARWGLAGFYIQQGSVDKAIEVVQGITKQNPKDVQAQLRLAELYMGKKDNAKAESIIGSVLSDNKNSAAAHYLMGRLQLTRNDSDKAISEFDSAIKLQDTFLPPYLDKANLLVLRGDLEGSQNTLNTALQRDRNNLLVRGAIAKVLALRQKPNEALQEADEVLKASPNSIDAIIARGDAMQSLGKLDEAKKEYQKLCGLQPNNAFYWYRLGVIEASHGDSASALLHLRKAIEVRHDFVAAITQVVSLHLKDKKFDAALADLDGFGKAGSPQDEIHRLRGEAYLAKGDDPAAERELRKAIEVNPQNYQSYMLLGQMNVRRNNIPQALKEVDQLIAKNNRYAPAYLLKATYLESAKDAQGAIATYRKVLELDQENAVASNNLAWLLCDSGNSLDEALSLARTARKKVPESTEIADTLGWIYYKMKNYTLAVDQLSFCVNNNQQPRADYYLHLGLAYYGKGDLRMAQQALQKSLSLNPNIAGADEARRILKLPS